MSLDHYYLNERIALLLGWKQNLEGPDLWDAPAGYVWEGTGIPDWANSKDLMLQEKRKLYSEQLSLFEKALGFILARDHFNQSWTPPSHMASATEEAEAMCMVLEGLSKP